MRPNLQPRGLWATSVLWLAVLAGRADLTSAEDGFVPDRHLPEGALLYAKADIARLSEGFAKTPLGKIVSHSGSIRAVGRLPSFAAEKIDEAAAEFRGKTGMGFLEALKLFRGEVVIAQYDFRAEQPPTTVFAIELRENKDGIRRLFDGVTKSWKEDGKEPEVVDIDGVKAEFWPIIRHDNEVDSFVSVELGSHLLVSLGKRARFEAAVRRFKSDDASAGGSIRDQPAVKSVLENCAVTDRAVVVAFDVGGFLAFLAEASVGFKPGAPGELIPSRLLTLFGLRKATSLGYALGFRDGDFEGRFRLEFGGESSGLLRAIADAVAPVRAVDDALAKIPVGAGAVVTKSVALGELYTRCVAEVKTHLPEHFEDFQDILHMVEQALGISFEEDVASLGRADWYAFWMDPPAGSLVHDGLALVQKSEFEGYRKVLEKVARASGSEISAEVAGMTVNVAQFGAPFQDEGDVRIWIGIASWCDLDDNWTLVANQPQAIRRFLEHYAKEKPLATDDAVSALVKEKAAADVVVVVRYGPKLVSRYNDVVTLIQALAPMFSVYLDPFDVEVAHLPIGEDFLDAISDGTLRVEFTPSHIDVHGRAVTTAITGSPFSMIAVGAIAAGVLVPTLLQSRSAADEVACQNNLLEIARMGALYADTGDNRHFPYAEEGGHATLQLLVDYFDYGDPSMFVCRSSDEHAAKVDADGKLTLARETCSYEFFPAQLSPEGDEILVYDRVPHHNGKRNVVMTSLVVRSLSEEDFQRRIEAQKKRLKGK